MSTRQVHMYQDKRDEKDKDKSEDKDLVKIRPVGFLVVTPYSARCSGCHIRPKRLPARLKITRQRYKG